MIDFEPCSQDHCLDSVEEYFLGKEDLELDYDYIPYKVSDEDRPPHYLGLALNRDC